MRTEEPRSGDVWIDEYSIDKNRTEVIMLLYESCPSSGLGGVWRTLVTRTDGSVRFGFNSIDTVKMWYEFAADPKRTAGFRKLV